MIPFLLTAALSTSAPGPCPPPGMTRTDLLQLKQTGFEVAAPLDRDRLAIALLSCLDDPDPSIRDGVAFEALSTWLRGKALTPATILSLGQALKEALRGPKDEGGFRRPFAALALSEVARADRLSPQFSDEARADLVGLAASSLMAVDDYRGFDRSAGWRHGVAHGADLILQLGLNQKVGADGLRAMMDAVRTRIAPQGAIFYTFGEPERLARAALFTHRRGVLDPLYWDAWFAAILDPQPLVDWRAAFQSVEGLAKRHNTVAFLHALSFAARAEGSESGKLLAERADKAVTQIGN